VTPQVAAREARPELMITHAPGYMFITDFRDEDRMPAAEVNIERRKMRR